MNAEAPEAETNHKRVRLAAISISLLGSLLILALKIHAARLAGSAALRSDALEGSVNVLAAAFGLGSVLFAEKPADQDHPYGHGKIEYFAQAFEGGLISLAGFLILIDTILRLIHHDPLQDLDSGLKLNLLAGLLNGILGFGMFLSGKKYHSQILISDGIHLLTDLVTTIGLGFGLLVVIFTGWTWLDPVLALLVALFLFRTGFKLVQESSNALLDAQSPALIEAIVGYLNEIPRRSVITVHELKVQQFGRDKHVDLHVVVPEFLSIKEAHDESDRFAADLMEKLGHHSIVHTHIDPCERELCTECPFLDCPIRMKPFQGLHPFEAAQITRTGAH
ncbi:MAG: cation diffusion facilitator family transporter [Bdellovibrionales bacterium]|nr:cation diffusion facilitator family transporter [Bdellovibrionales bacterium]